YRVVQDRGVRSTECLSVVEDEVGGLGDVEPPLALSDQEAFGDGPVRRVAFDQGERVLGPFDGDPEGDDAQMLGEMDPSTMTATSSSSERSAAISSESEVSLAATRRRDTEYLDTERVWAVTFSPIWA
ncbi:MAG TPA: hypothetical protein VN886_20860, partial [Acidimicrobiales bacterium]|nr:hypothetical protein [Acidimicrobiales bacterium]